MSIAKLWGWILLVVTLSMIVAYSRLLEANLESGLLLGAEFRLHRVADAWIDSKSDPSRQELADEHSGDQKLPMPPIDGTPILYARTESLPPVVQQNLPDLPTDGQFTVIGIDEIGLLYRGHLLHLYRTWPTGEHLHVVQRLVLAEHERERVQQFDAKVNMRLESPLLFFGVVLLIVLFFGRRVANATSKLLHWCESLPLDSLPEKPPILPFVEMRRIAAGTLATVRRERDAIEHQHRFLRFASHELRTPLAVASANAELLARYGVGKSGSDALDRLADALNNMGNLTDTLLWLGRGEVQLPEPESVDLLDLVTDIIETHNAEAISNNLEVEVVWASQAHTVQPRVLLEILCSNLIINAIRHTREGRVEVRLTGETIEIENRGNQLEQEVTDGDGQGLALEIVAWVVARANWQWDEVGDVMFRRHRVHLNPA